MREVLLATSSIKISPTAKFSFDRHTFKIDDVSDEPESLALSYSIHNIFTLYIKGMHSVLPLLLLLWWRLSLATRYELFGVCAQFRNSCSMFMQSAIRWNIFTLFITPLSFFLFFILSYPIDAKLIYANWATGNARADSLTAVATIGNVAAVAPVRWNLLSPSVHLWRIRFSKYARNLRSTRLRKIIFV